MHYLQDTSVVLHFPISRSQSQSQDGTDQENGQDVVPLSDPSSHTVTIYGAPWQPAFWGGFNLPRHSEILREKWRMIPSRVDILLTHSPPHGILGW